MIDAYVSRPHFLDHLAPIAAALGGSFGKFYVPQQMAGYARDRGVSVTIGTPPRKPPEPIMVAGYDDCRQGKRPTILVEHGAGQSYRNDHPCYHDGQGRDHIKLHIVPSERVADEVRIRYPRSTVVAVGCPKLDARHSKIAAAGPRLPQDDRRPVVAFAWHWSCKVAPESDWAWPHYAREFGAIVNDFRLEGIEVIGTVHPRANATVAVAYRAAGVPMVTADDVLDRADVLVADNTSLQPEFASLGKPLVWLSAPWYRREIEHGGRFWDWPRGQIQVEDPEKLVSGVSAAIDDASEIGEARAQMIETIYGRCDGLAAVRAATAILEMFGA